MSISGHQIAPFRIAPDAHPPRPLVATEQPDRAKLNGVGVVMEYPIHVVDDIAFGLDQGGGF